MVNVENKRLDSYTVNGARFQLLDPDSSVSKETTEGLDYEPAVTQYLKQILEKETLSFLDVGAHYGYYTVYVSKISPDSRVYSFEPGVKHLKVLRENIQINDVKAEIYDVALSDETKEVLFHNRTMKFAGQLETETIKAITFDELNNQEDIRPEIVKIDVHGAEGKVLYGMKTALKEAVKYLFIEIHAAHLLVDYSYKEILDILLDSGFKLFEMDKFRDTTSPVLVPIVGSVYEDFINFDKWTEDQIKRERMIFATKDPNTK
jgi:FkbM family methyltransferase